MDLQNKSTCYRRFLAGYYNSLKETNESRRILAPRFTNSQISTAEIEGECLEWCLNFLTTRQCPDILAAAVAREVYSRLAVCDLTAYLDEEDSCSSYTSQPDSDGGKDNENKEYRAEALHSFVMATLEVVMLAWSTDVPALAGPTVVYECSFHAIKNTRRNMEDSHVIVPDLNTLFGLKGETCQSFYAVFDGHAGATAAMFAARQLHCNLVRHCGLGTTHPDDALKAAHKMTDEAFITKSRKQKWRSGSTCVSALIRNGKLHLAWLGDSQAVLVRGGRVVTHLEPHKPDRQDERERIEALGGCVMLVGDMWRVGGNLAVSRAIGDAGYKPFVSSDCEVLTMELDGTEDYVVLACDGAWDAITYDTLPGLVYNYLAEPTNDRASVANMLVQYAKDNDSTDNISIIVVFFRENISVPKADIGFFDFFGAEMCESEEDVGDSSATGRPDEPARDNMTVLENNGQLQGDSHAGEDISENAVLAGQCGVCDRRDKAPGDVDLDYYGVFDTRLVDGPVDLTFLDMPNSSKLLKGIAETMYSGQYDAVVPSVHIQWKDEAKPQQSEPSTTEQQLDLTISPDKNIPIPKMEYVHEKQTIHKYSRKGQSPICWAFTGKNRATVQNYRLKQAAKSSMRGPISLSELSTTSRRGAKNDNVHALGGNVNSDSSNKNTSGMTVFGSKTNIQRETKKFHSSWRPKKPVKPITTAVCDLPPSPFVHNRLDGLR